MIFGAITGRLSKVSAAAIAGAEEGVTLGLRLLGPLCLWSGVGEVLRQTGLQSVLSQGLAPILGRLFPRLYSHHREGFSALCANVTANLLGLGNAATPMGIRACRAMNDGTGRATREQCRLILLNTASLQLIPTTVLSLRVSLGSRSPGCILPGVLLSSLTALGVGLGLLLLLERRSRE